MARRPNIVICMCDQLRPFEIGCYGHPTVRTPNMDRMASEGPWFRTACSNSPLCIPARSVLLSGQYARTCTGTSSNFCGFPPSRERVVCQDPTLPEILRDAGYRTGIIGKWHLHPAPDLVGFQEGVYPHNLHQHHRQSFYDLKGRRTVVEGFSLDYEFDHVRDFVRRRGEEPFFLHYSLSPPHMPLMDAPEKYTKMYSREQVRLRDNVRADGEIIHQPEWFRAYLWDYLGHLALHLNDPEVYMPDDYRVRKSLAPTHGLKRVLSDVRDLMDDPDIGDRIRERFPYLDDRLLDDFDLTELTALYYGMATCVDDYLGRLLELLDDDGIADDTIVVFTSDHGDNLGSHHLWMKDHVYDEAARVPLLFRAPGCEGREIGSQVGTLVDVAPTLLSLAGVETPPHFQGVDLSGVMRGSEETAGENLAFIEAWRHRMTGVRSPNHLYAIGMVGEHESEWAPSDKIEGHLFFDLRDDPYEQNNLAETDERAETASLLRERLLSWHTETPRRPMPQPTGTVKSVAIY